MLCRLYTKGGSQIANGQRSFVPFLLLQLSNSFLRILAVPNKAVFYNIIIIIIITIIIIINTIITGEQLSSGSNLAKEARLDIHARGFWEKHQSAFFDIRVCHPNAESYKQMEPKQIYRLHENEKKRSYSRRVLDIEHGSFTPLVFTSTGGMGPECLRFHSRLAELIADKKGEHYSRTISWITDKNFLCFIEICADLLKRVKNYQKTQNGPN